MGLPQYNYSALGGADYYSLMNDKYLMAAMQAPNVNFKSAQSEQTGTAQSTVGAKETAGSSSGAIPVDYSKTQPESSNAGLWITGAIGATALIAMLAKGRGNIVDGAKSLFKSISKSTTTKSSNKSTILTRMQAVKNGNGELKINVPNKTKTFAGSNVEDGVREYGLQGAIADSRRVFNPQEASLARGFQMETPIGKYTVLMEDGKISKVIFRNGGAYQDVYSELVAAKSGTTDAELLEKFKKIAEELGKAPNEADKTIFKDVINISYVNRYGDDTLKLTMEKFGASPKLKSFNTLKQFSKDDVEVMQYVPSSSEGIFVEDLVKKTGIINKKEVLVDGVGVLKCEKDIAGAKCYFNGDKLERIVIGTDEFTEGSFGYDKFIKDNQKAIDGFVKDVFVDKIVEKIPLGATIGIV